MGHTSQKRLQIEYRRKQVSELYLKERTQADIARELGVSQATISSDIKALRKEWEKSRIRNTDELIAEQFKKHQLLSREAWDGWERSKEPVETTRAIQSHGQMRVEKTVRQQAGDPRFLRIVANSMDSIDKFFDLKGAASAAKEQLNEEENRKRAVSMLLDMMSKPPSIDDDPLERFLAEERKKSSDENLAG